MLINVITFEVFDYSIRMTIFDNNKRLGKMLNNVNIQNDYLLLVKTMTSKEKVWFGAPRSVFLLHEG